MRYRTPSTAACPHKYMRAKGTTGHMHMPTGNGTPSIPKKRGQETSDP